MRGLSIEHAFTYEISVRYMQHSPEVIPELVTDL
jgi:hypothetical protein